MTEIRAVVEAAALDNKDLVAAVSQLVKEVGSFARLLQQPQQKLATAKTTTAMVWLTNSTLVGVKPATQANRARARMD